MKYSIFSDESCHMERDGLPIMLLGAIWCPKSDVKARNAEIRGLKEEHGARGELKWLKVSNSRETFFLSLVDYFFDTQNLNFRCLVVDDKSRLDHSYFNKGSHDSFYYKMYYYLLRNIISNDNQYVVYLDIKDTRSQLKIRTLKSVLCRSFNDFEEETIQRTQHIRSDEAELLQLADFLMGAVSYRCRGLETNATKLAVIRRVRQRSRLSLLASSPPWEDKFNLFFFSPSVV